MRRKALATALSFAFGLPAVARAASLPEPSLRLERRIDLAAASITPRASLSVSQDTSPIPVALTTDRVLGNPPRAPTRSAVSPAPITAPSGAGLPEGTEVYVDMLVNGESRGEVILRFGRGGALLIERRELASRNLDPRGAPEVSIGAATYVDLRAIPGATAAFDERKLELKVSLPAESFERRVIDLKPAGRADAVHTNDTSAFANYRFEHTQAGDSGAGIVLGHDVGVRWNGWLLHTEGSLDHRDGHTLSTRYLTQAVYDDRIATRRWILGDAVASSGDTGSAFPIGGIAFTKAYQLNPYLVPQPLAGFSGTVTAPSELEVYLGNTQVIRQRLSPGPFDLRNFSYYGGQRDIRVVVRDAFGREQAVDFPFYFTDRSLSAGLHDFGYFAGSPRELPGDTSGRYHDFAATFFHRYGVTDWFTAGARGETSEGRSNAGLDAILRFERWGVLSLEGSGSRDRDSGRSGSAATASYLFQREPWNLRLLGRRFDASYVVANLTAAATLPLREGSAGVSYTSPRLGTLDAGASYLQDRDKREQRTTSLSYSRSFGGRFNLIASLRHNRGDLAPGTEIFVGLFYNPKPDVSASLFHNRTDTVRSTVAQVSRTVDPGEGLGYRLSLEQDQGASHATRVSPYLQYNLPYATLIADVGEDLQTGRSTFSRRFAVQGAITLVGGHVGFSRPVYDSFAQVSVEPAVAGIRVYQNNLEIGRTPDSGRILIPNLGSFHDNILTIDHRDVPIEYAIDSVSQVISPPYRSGSNVIFPLAKVQGVSARLVRHAEGKVIPLTYHEGRLRVGKDERVFPIGGDGGFYLENLPEGVYGGSAQGAGNACRFKLEVPASNDPIVELKEPVVCETLP